MKKLISLPILILFFVNSGYSQHNMLGKSQKYISSFYSLSRDFSQKIDTIGQNTILLTYKTQKQYPFYTYEIELMQDECVSYGIVAKDKTVLKTYFEMLNYIGEIVKVDSTYNNFVYKIETSNKTSYFTIKQPFINSQFLSRRSVFYILVSEKKRIPEIIEE